MKKQLRGLFCAAALAAVLALPARAAEQTHRAYLCGYPDGSIQPGAPVTRAQLACALVRLAEEPLPEPERVTFFDVPGDHWACAQIGKLYTLRDDERGVSFNAGIITGGTAENVIAPYAECRCEFRCFGRAAELEERIRALCAQEPVPGATTRVSFGAPHPPVDLNERSQALLDRARAIGARLGLTLTHERTGSAGDISIAAQAGIGVLDGLGLPGEQTHTAGEFAYIDELEPRIRLCARLIASLCGGADRATEL